MIKRFIRMNPSYFEEFKKTFHDVELTEDASLKELWHGSYTTTQGKVVLQIDVDERYEGREETVFEQPDDAEGFIDYTDRNK